MPRLRPPSPAMCVALLGLSVALGGTTWAATSLPARSVGTAQLRADAVTGPKVLNHSLTGADIKSSSLGTVPSARTAAFATSARTALTADAAGIAYSTHSEAATTLPGTAPGTPPGSTTIASLHIPAGSYVLMAKAQVDSFGSGAIVGCDLVAENDKDTSFVQGGGNFHQSAIVSNSLVHAFAAAGTVNLTCIGGLDAATISQVRLTAVTVGKIIPA